MDDITPTEPQRVPAPRSSRRGGLEMFAATHPGRLRAANEDAFRIEPSIGLAVVADGVASYKGGGVAARTTVDTVCRFLLSGGGPRPGTDESPEAAAARRLGAAVVEAHGRVRREAARTRCSHMATTLAALWCTAGHAIVMHAGDSRVYRLRAGELVPLTEDHTVAAEYGRISGELPPEIQRRFGHVLTRAVSALDEEVSVDVRILPLEAGDTFVLCSDGLTGELAGADIAAVVAAGDACGAVRALVRAANEAGGMDNITVAVVRFRGGARSDASGPVSERERESRSPDAEHTQSQRGARTGDPEHDHREEPSRDPRTPRDGGQ